MQVFLQRERKKTLKEETEARQAEGKSNFSRRRGLPAPSPVVNEHNLITFLLSSLATETASPATERCDEVSSPAVENNALPLLPAGVGDFSLGRHRRRGGSAQRYPSSDVHDVSPANGGTRGSGTSAETGTGRHVVRGDNVEVRTTRRVHTDSFDG